MTFLTSFQGYRSYIISTLVFVIGLLFSANIIDGVTAGKIIALLLGLLGFSMRSAITQASKK